MHIDEDSCEWLGFPSPLEMYKHHAALLYDEIAAFHLQLRKAKENVREGGCVDKRRAYHLQNYCLGLAEKVSCRVGRINQKT